MRECLWVFFDEKGSLFSLGIQAEILDGRRASCFSRRCLQRLNVRRKLQEAEKGARISEEKMLMGKEAI